MNKGFTLIELLVVVAIIGVLASTVLVSLSEVRTKSAYTKARLDIQQLARMTDYAKSEQGKVLLDITGDHCSECDCRAKGNIHALPKSDICWTTYFSVFDTIKSATNGGYELNEAPIDPWGGPYLINENESEPFPDTTRPNCVTDIILSAGPNGEYYDSDDIVYNLPAVSCSPLEPLHHPNVNWFE